LTTWPSSATVSLVFSRLLSPWRPEAYHGFGRTRGFFEGWYYKCVTRDEGRAVAVIPGVSLAPDPADSHAFIQFADARRGRAHYFRYPLSEFRAHPSRFEVRIGANEFRSDGLTLDLRDEALSIRGRLSFQGVVPWPVRLLSPGVMGWYAFVPRMECDHAVLSFDHRIAGGVEIDGSAVDFERGKGYIEKDWGASFPAAWIWFQTNHFDEDGTSLFGSVAKIPWRGRFFTGFLFALWRKGRLVPFTTYGGARLTRLEVDADKIALEVENRETVLEIRAERCEGVDLPAPVMGAMSSKVNESLKARIEARLFRQTPAGREAVFSGTGRCAGLEFVGDIGVLVSGLKS
jgi:tocopherol cyclase